MVRLDRISHPEWVKLCVDPNGQIKLHAKQKYEILSATNVYLEIHALDWNASDEAHLVI